MKYKLEKATAREAIKRGLGDTYAYYKNDWKHILQNVFSAFVAMLFLWIIWGRSAMVSEVQVLIAGVLGAVSWGLIVLAYNFIVAPVKLSYEKAIGTIVADSESPDVNLVPNWVIYPPDRASAIGIEITNKEQSQIECYSFIKKITLNGKDITSVVTYYTQRLSWNGGSDKDRGIKCIEADGGTARVNVGIAKREHFCFETDKGDRNISGNGTLSIDIELRGTMDGKQITPLMLNAEFIQKGENVSFEK